MEKVTGTLSRPPSRDPGGGYNYEPYHFSSSTSSATVSAAAIKLQQPEQQPQHNKTNKTCCSMRCCRQFTRTCCSNVGVCLLLVAYTLLGSLIFLAIEGNAGGGGTYDSFVEPTIRPTQLSPEQQANMTAWLRRANAASRARAVENIWDVTVSLNILYRENWTRLAAEELAKFQDEVTRRLMAAGLRVGDGLSPSSESRRRSTYDEDDDREWTFAKAFLYSLTLLTTIGHGGMAPRTALGKVVTILYALLGIPLMLLYLSSVGSTLSLGLRRVLTGKCPCHDPSATIEEISSSSDPPFYLYNNVASSSKSKPVNSPTPRANVLLPIIVCLVVIMTYIGGGAAVMIKWNYSYLDGLFFCFMSLSTIGFGDIMSANKHQRHYNGDTGSQQQQSTWFCAMYILVGMALTATCFNIIHDEVNSKLRQARSKSTLSKNKPDVTNNDDIIIPSVQVQTPVSTATTNNGGTFS